MLIHSDPPTEVSAVCDLAVSAITRVDGSPMYVPGGGEQTLSVVEVAL